MHATWQCTGLQALSRTRYRSSQLCPRWGAQPAAMCLRQVLQGLPHFEDIKGVAEGRGLDLQLQRLGPFYRIQCHEGNAGGTLLGTTNGFTLAPIKLMHCDTMQIYTRGRGGESGDRVRGGILGLGTLLAAAVFAHGYWSGCRKAEILAINDNDHTHQRLRRYYRRVFGFREVREVGENGLRDLPDLLVWGGAGTRMEGDLEQLLSKSAKTFSHSLAEFKASKTTET